MKIPAGYGRALGALLLGLTIATMAGCGNDEPPNPDAAPESEQPMGQGPMSNEDAGETPSDGV